MTRCGILINYLLYIVESEAMRDYWLLRKLHTIGYNSIQQFLIPLMTFFPKVSVLWVSFSLLGCWLHMTYFFCKNEFTSHFFTERPNYKYLSIYKLISRDKRSDRRWMYAWEIKNMPNYSLPARGYCKGWYDKRSLNFSFNWRLYHGWWGSIDKSFNTPSPVISHKSSRAMISQAIRLRGVRLFEKSRKIKAIVQEFISKALDFSNPMAKIGHGTIIERN